MHFQHKQGHSYLLVTEVMETIFKFIVSALCALPKPLQHLQKKREPSFKGQKLNGNTVALLSGNLADSYLFFASA